MDTEQLRLKIKSIKDAYRQEVGKVLMTDEVYIPKLIWLNQANLFLYEVTNTRTTSSNLVSNIQL